MATVNGTAGPDVIHQAGDGVTIPPGYTDITGVTAFADSIEAGDDDDIVYGGGGSDIIYGGLGVDTLYGGAGFDEFRVRNLAELGSGEVIDAGGAGTLSGSLVFLCPGGIVDLTEINLIDVATLSVTSLSTGDFYFKLTAGQFLTFASIFGHQEFVSLEVTGPVVFEGFKTIVRVDQLLLSESDDILSVQGGVGPSDSTFALSGRGGDDRLAVQSSIETNLYWLDGGQGDDRLSVANGSATLVGGEGRDRLSGGRQGDALIGGEGADKLNGRARGDDLAGGGSADIFVFSKPKFSRLDAPDTISDFEADGGDIIDLHRIDANSEVEGDQSFLLAGDVFTGAAGELIQFSANGDLVVTGDIDGDAVGDFAIIVTNVDALSVLSFVL